MYGHQGGKAVVEGGRVGGGVMNWTIGIEMYTLMCIKLMTNKNLLYKKNRKNLFIRFIDMCAILKKTLLLPWEKKKDI